MRKDVADRNRIGETLADITEEARLVPRAPADDEADFSGPGAVARDERPVRSVDRLQVNLMGLDGSIQHLFDDFVRVVEEFLDVGAIGARCLDKLRAVRSLASSAVTPSARKIP